MLVSYPAHTATFVPVCYRRFGTNGGDLSAKMERLPYIKEEKLLQEREKSLYMFCECERKREKESVSNKPLKE